MFWLGVIWIRVEAFMGLLVYGFARLWVCSFMGLLVYGFARLWANERQSY